MKDMVKEYNIEGMVGNMKDIERMTKQMEKED